MAKIVVVDDDEMLRGTIRRHLTRAGHDVLEAGDGKEGVELVARFAPDLVITDINMPDQEGIQTILELREADPQIPIIVISGEGKRGDYAPLQDARLLGADVALEKPFELTALLSEVEILLGADGES